jgi:4-hydroxy-2-oxoheptanedioate aldolase
MLFNGGLATRVRAKQPLVGTFVTIGHPAVCEILGAAGFDFLVLDMEHGYVPTNIAGLIAAASHDGTYVVVRVPNGQAPWIGMALDAGADGILVPQVHTPEAARKVALMARYPPQGRRGLGPSRATGYGGRLVEYLVRANQQVLVAIQIESREALDALPEIASVDGIDMLFVGPGDLSVSLGVPGSLDNEVVTQGTYRTLKVANDMGMSAGVFVAGEAQARRWLLDGFSFVVVSSDTGFLMRGLVDPDSLRAVRSMAAYSPDGRVP